MIAEVTALLTAVAGFAWPLAGIVIVLLLRKYAAQILAKDSVTLRVAGMELSLADAAKQSGTALADLVERVAQLETRIADDARVSAKPAEAIDLKTGEVSAGGDVRDSQRKEGASVLWVDDFPSNNAFLIEKFQRSGVEVRTELSTSAGIIALHQEVFNFIISDLGRHENGVENRFAGLDFVKSVRSAGFSTPILIFAGQRGLQNRERLLSEGANEVTASAVDVFRFVMGRGA